RCRKSAVRAQGLRRSSLKGGSPPPTWAADGSSCRGGSWAMGKAGQAADHACDGLRIEASTRRGFLTVLSVLGLDVAALPALAQPASERPKEEDFLVSIDSDTPDALELKDIPIGGPPVLAWPMDPPSNTGRKDSRLKKILLVRLDPLTPLGSNKDPAAGRGVALFPLLPPPRGGGEGWVAEQQILECSCHYSHYNPREGAAVIDGPASRALPALPLKLVDGKLAVAKPFTSRVGIVPT